MSPRVPPHSDKRKSKAIVKTNCLKPFTVFLFLACLNSSAFAEDDIGLPSIDPKDSESVDLLKDKLDLWQSEDGREITNWKALGGVLANGQRGANLMTKDKYRDFDLSLEFNLPKEGNSGVYLRGRYEVQLLDGSESSLLRKTGAIWGQIPVDRVVNTYKGANTWNELSVRIKGDRVSVMINRIAVIRTAKLKEPTAGAIDRDEDQPGPILLQSHSGVRFRKILIKVLSSNAN